MNVLTWNVKGLGESVKRAGVRDFCALNKVDVICFQETKLASVNASILRSIGMSQNFIWAWLDAEGSAGDSLIGWDSQKWLGSHRLKDVTH